ncbi:MAG: RIP metalloprotease RseP [Firmicutes bacterium]|nr:RIP metalloprotease RseP [Dethiobacter sp.]MBS3888680.1 RIP metalloprotease RseP [Bacillota bacterium]
MVILMAIAIIGVLVFFHELGHFLTAKASGMMVHEFALGMGPVLLAHTRGETKYSLRMLPIGGFLRVAGEENEPGKLAIPFDRRYDTKPVWQRMVFVAGGSLMNFVLASLIFAIIFMAVGVPTTEPLIGSVTPDWPAAQAGLQIGDRVVNIEGRDIATWTELQRAIGETTAPTITVEILRDETRLTLSMTPRVDEATGRRLVGVAPANVRHGFFTALFLGTREVVWFTAEILSVIGRMVTGRMPAEGAGPIGMVVMVGEVARTGLANLLSFAAIISIQLGMFNLLPIPALDGSKLVFLALEGVRGKPIAPERENMIHFLGFVMLMVLIVLVTYQDLQRLNIF